MTDRKQALIKLRDKVKAGETPNQDEFRAVFDWHKDQRHQLAVIACDPSDIRAMGAAKALHEAVLPEWGWQVWGGGYATIENGEGDEIDIDHSDLGCPARAWLLSILEALIAQEEIT